MPSEEDQKVVPKEATEKDERPPVEIKWTNPVQSEQGQWVKPFQLEGRWLKSYELNVGVIPEYAFQDNRQNLFVGQAVDAHEEHEKTRQLISERLAELPQREDLLNAKEEMIGELSDRIKELQSQLEKATADLVKTQELEVCTKTLCDQIRLENEETRQHMDQELTELRVYLSKFAPHRRFFRVTFGLLCLFSVSLIIFSAFGVKIVEPFWAAVGVVLSSAMLIVIYFGMKDDQVTNKDSSER